MEFKNGSILSRLVLLCTLLCLGIAPLHAENVAEGKALFEEKCQSCHELSAKLVGPALKDVHTRRNEEWLIKWIKNSQAVIKSGDPYAVKLFEEYQKSVMTSFADLKDDQIKSILAYIKAGDVANTEVASAPGDRGTTTITENPKGEGDGAAYKGQVTWLIVIALLAFLIIVVQIFNVLKLVSDYTRIPFFNPNRTNGMLMIVFLVVGLIAAVWEFKHHGAMLLPDAVSEHGLEIDFMFNVTLIITGFVFVVTQILLFWYAYKYQAKEGRKAYFYSHNNRLEVIWTVIPAIALTVLVLNGFKVWDNIFEKAPEKSTQIEVFAYQFGWKVRYPGADGKLGDFNFNLISSSNELGIGIRSEYETLIDEIKKEADDLQKAHDELALIPDPTKKEAAEIKENARRLKLKKTHYDRLVGLSDNKNLFSGYAMDDILPTEIHVPVDEPVNLNFRARDVIHSAYMPYFRIQMNCVPGMPTSFWFVPTKTTKDMRAEKKDPKFDYYLFCAKICGAAHFNMKIKVVVESRAEYNKWLASQQPKFMKQAETPAAAPAPAAKPATQAVVSK